jgi:hypothetical protein
VWARLYKRDLLRDINFVEGITKEDMAHTISLYKKHPKTIFLKEPLYYYNYNPDSLVNTAQKNILKDIQDMYSALLFIYETYKSAPKREFDFIAKEVVLKYLKDQFKAIKKADKSEQAKLYDFFTKELVDLDSKNFIRLKWRRLFIYLKFKKMIKWALKNAKTN